jgi:dihydroorotate dehydrogenase electron transfer subunit
MRDPERSTVQAEVHSLREVHPHYFLQRFLSPPFSFQPGQFVMVKPSGTLDPFLPRAYSILRMQGQGAKGRGRHTTAVEILYKVVGRGTTALASLRPGERVDLLGPLGNSYHVPPTLQTALLVAGGIGVPPVVALAERLAQGQRLGRRSSVVGRRKLVAFIGGRTANDILCVTDLRKAGTKVHVATEDGSLGSPGLVTDLLEEYLRSSVVGRRSTIYACGPHPMLHAVAKIAERFHVPCQVSMEASMACGFGACMGCVIPVHGSQFRVQGSGFRVHRPEKSMNHEPSTVNQQSYKLCCKDGPVFDAQEIAW